MSSAARNQVVPTTQYLTFSVAGEQYAIAILRVREILQFTALTVVPTLPDYVRGVLNLRGAVVPVIDLAAKLRMGQSAIAKLTCILIIEVQNEGDIVPIGLLIDAFGHVMELSPEDIEPPPSFGTRIRADYLLGMAKSDSKFALLLDPDRVLSEEEILATATEAKDAESSAGIGTTADGTSSDAGESCGDSNVAADADLSRASESARVDAESAVRSEGERVAPPPAPEVSLTHEPEDENP